VSVCVCLFAVSLFIFLIYFFCPSFYFQYSSFALQLHHRCPVTVTYCDGPHTLARPNRCLLRPRRWCCAFLLPLSLSKHALQWLGTPSTARRQSHTPQSAAPEAPTSDPSFMGGVPWPIPPSSKVATPVPGLVSLSVPLPFSRFDVSGQRLVLSCFFWAERHPTTYRPNRANPELC
jgi:hypothetical protein